MFFLAVVGRAWEWPLKWESLGNSGYYVYTVVTDNIDKAEHDGAVPSVPEKGGNTSVPAIVWTVGVEKVSFLFFGKLFLLNRILVITCYYSVLSYFRIC